MLPSLANDTRPEAKRVAIYDAAHAYLTIPEDQPVPLKPFPMRPVTNLVGKKNPKTKVETSWLVTGSIGVIIQATSLKPRS